MNSREVFPDEELRRRIMDFIMAAGQTLLENGAEVFRVEQTMEIMARSFHLREFHVYVLTNGIFASAGTAEISEVRIYNNPIDRICQHLQRSFLVGNCVFLSCAPAADMVE